MTALIKNGARTLLGAGFVLACLGSTTALAGLQVDQTVERAGPWTIGYNSSLKGCVASSTSDDGTTVWIGFEGSEPETPAYLAFTNPNWRSIEARKFYDLEIQASGSYRWRGYGSGVERPNEKGLFVFGVKRRALQDFAQTSGLVLSINKEPLTRTNISGLSEAIEKLVYCQEHRLFALKNQGTKTITSGAEAPKQQDRPPAEPPSVSSQLADTSRHEEAVAVRLESEKKGPAEQANVARAEVEVRVQAAHENAGDARTEGVAPNPLPAAAAQTAADPELKGDALVRAIKQELKRVGCFSGPIDNDWQTPPARASIQKFAQHAAVTISLAEPTNALLDAIKIRAERVCPPEPAVYPTRRNARHIARKCPGGFNRDEDGDCPPRRKAMTRHDIDDEDRPRARSRESRRRGRDID